MKLKHFKLNKHNVGPPGYVYDNNITIFIGIDQDEPDGKGEVFFDDCYGAPLHLGLDKYEILEELVAILKALREGELIEDDAMEGETQ